MSKPPMLPTDAISAAACPRCAADLGKPNAERLLVVDVDGTLVRRDGSIDARDREAIRELTASGTMVALATGRLARSALRPARELAIRTPLICADGSVIVCGTCEQPIHRRGLEVSLVTSAVEQLHRAGLAVFPFFAEAVRYHESARDYVPWLGSWSEGSVVHPNPLATLEDEDVVALLGMGPRDDVQASSHALQVPRDRVELGTFEVASDRVWALRVHSRGVHKGSAVLLLRDWLGLERRQVAAVGDGYNDVPLFAEAGRSFAMANAPDGVRTAASEVLASSAESGGAVAEAAARLGPRFF